MHMKPNDPRDWLRGLASTAIAGVMACSLTGWTYTVRELNAVTAYQPVGGKALRLTRPWKGPAGQVRLVRDSRAAPQARAH
jgi:hypothetical protein